MISDLHLNLNYDENYGPRVDQEGDCWVTSGTLSDVKAPYGRYGCDPPSSLIDVMLDEFNRSHGKQDVIFLTGDLSSHHTAMDIDDTSGENTYPLLMATHAGIIEHLNEKFPDTLVLPVFGNNDAKFHDNPIPIDDEEFFYEYIFDLWFDLLPGNKAWLTSE